MLEKTLTDIESLAKERNLGVETVALILETASTYYDGNSSQLINAQMRLRLKETVSGSHQPIKEYLSLLGKKGHIEYHKEQELHIPRDKGMHFLRIYRTLASLII